MTVNEHDEAILRGTVVHIHADQVHCEVELESADGPVVVTVPMRALHDGPFIEPGWTGHCPTCGTYSGRPR